MLIGFNLMALNLLVNLHTFEYQKKWSDINRLTVTKFRSSWFKSQSYLMLHKIFLLQHQEGMKAMPRIPSLMQLGEVIAIGSYTLEEMELDASDEQNPLIRG